MDVMNISVLDDGDFFIQLEDEYYVYHTADEVLNMVKSNTNIQLDIDNLEYELKKMCLKYGLKLK